MILSVVIPTCNKHELLARTMGALLSEELAAEWEIVVVDDGSRDGTGALLAKLAHRHPERIRVVKLEKNVGRAAARNRGVREAAGRWILFLDDDIVAPPGLLAAHLACLAGCSDCGTIGHVRTSPDLVDGPHFFYLDTRGVSKVSQVSVPARYFVTQNACVPREAFLAVGGFNESFAAYGFEDMEVAFRLEDEQGLVFRPVSAPVPVHVHHHTLDQYLAKKRECGRHSLPLLAKLHPHRILEMRLHWIIDTANGRAPSPMVRLARTCVHPGIIRLLTQLARRWPTVRSGRPYLSRIYCLLMDVLVVLSYREGLTNENKQHDNTTEQ